MQSKNTKKWLKRAQKAPKWPKNDQKWLKIVQNGLFFLIFAPGT